MGPLPVCSEGDLIVLQNKECEEVNDLEAMAVSGVQSLSMYR